MCGCDKEAEEDDDDDVLWGRSRSMLVVMGVGGDSIVTVIVNATVWMSCCSIGRTAF
jgi:hypothetical protein